MVAEGEVLARKYRVDRLLGVGGMGLVVAATDLSRHEQVALKMMRPEAMGSPELVARFLREATAASQLTSQHVARVRDYGTLDGGGGPFIVMELLRGEDVAALLKRRGPLPVGEAIDIVLQVCDALAEAHALGIVHRDVTPANVFLAAMPWGSMVKVLDFGVATSGPLDGPVASMTSTGAVLGSPTYMSPEQLHSSKHVDARADIWSLGVILYELLTGKVPIDADSIGGMLGALHLVEPQPVRATRPDVPPALDAIVLRCMAKNKEARFSSAGELALALAPFAGERARAMAQQISSRPPPQLSRAAALPSAAPPRAVAPIPPPSASSAAALPHAGAPRRSRRRRGPPTWLVVIAILVAMAALFVFAAVVAWRFYPR